MSYFIIYKITNTINNKIYIGSHKTLNINDDYMGSGKLLIRAQLKYGIEHFNKEILYVLDSPEKMYAKEAEIVNEEFISNPNTYNIKLGGLGGFDYINSTKKNLYGYNGHTPNVKDNFARGRVTFATRKQQDPEYAKMISKKISNTLTGRPGPMKGKHHTVHSKSLIGSKNSISQAGSKNSQYGKMWITDGVNNKSIPKTEVVPVGWYKGRKINIKK